MAHKRRKSTKRTTGKKSPFGKVGNWGESSWTGGPKRNKPDAYNKTMARAFK